MKTDLFAPISTRRARVRPFEWLIEPFFDDPSFVVRPMFGAHACYLRGRLVLVLAGRHQEPWHGILVPTEREHHESLRRELPALTPHEVLGKWLYLSASGDSFEEIEPLSPSGPAAAPSRVVTIIARTHRPSSGHG